MTSEDPKSEMLEAPVQGTDVAVDETKPEKFDEARAMDLIRKQREELKQAKKAAAELERYKLEEEKRKQAEMTESERLKAELDKARSELKAKTARTMQIEVAAKVGIPAALSDRLKGETLEEMEEDAKAILDMLPKQKAAPNTGATNPGEKAGSGDTFEDAHKRWKAGEKQANPFLGGGVVFPPFGGNQ
jgi:hypothetical protein